MKYNITIDGPYFQSPGGSKNTINIVCKSCAVENAVHNRITPETRKSDWSRDTADGL